ncbi:hypothetical protein E2C01_032661 [Portunus trituberculatus]|uniref:Uncharacterized protein n=1 Tax=Portunus trituberculatus TaxID=210409 RepID=A0A5B7F1M8_PORTR|nr:hypothetical protein [Portunus trituberculatus]
MAATHISVLDPKEAVFSKLVTCLVSDSRSVQEDQGVKLKSRSRWQVSAARSSQSTSLGQALPAASGLRQSCPSPTPPPRHTLSFMVMTFIKLRHPRAHTIQKCKAVRSLHLSPV